MSVCLYFTFTLCYADSSVWIKLTCIARRCTAATAAEAEDARDADARTTLVM